MSSCLRAIWLVALLAAIASESSALTFTIDASDSGSHSSAGNHAAANENYSAGWSSNETLRDFFVFDVSGLPAGETVTSVTLRLYNPAVGEPDVTYTGGYDSPDATETYELRQVLLASALVTAPSVLNPAVYTALGAGALFGSATISAADNGQFVDITLNATGVSAVDTAVAEFVLGGLVSSLTSAPGIDEFVFGHTDPLDANPGSPYARQLCVTTTGGPDTACFAPIPEPGTGALVLLGLLGFAAARSRRLGRSALAGLLALGGAVSLAPAAHAGVVTTQIKVLSNRADLISGGNALVEIVPAPPPGTVIMAGGANVTSAFAPSAGGSYRGLVSGLAVGTTTLTVTLPDSTGASIALRNHPIEGPVFSGPHLQPWDCKTSEEGLGQPSDANCNAPTLVDYLYVPTTGGGYVAYDVNSPPANVGTITNDRGATVRNIIRRERGSINRGLYAFAVLHDPALGEPDPRNPQPGFNGKLFYPFGASCNTNQTQGTMPNVVNQTRLQQGYAVATTSLNVLGHHCNPVISAETAMMTKERVVETIGPIRFTLSDGGSGGAIGQLQVSQAYPGITNGLMPSQMFPDVWSTGMEVSDCFLTETYWPKAAVPFTPFQKAAVDGHGPTQSSCAAWVALFVPTGIPTHGCFSGSTIPAGSAAGIDPARDYNPVTNPEGCRATVNDLQVNVWGRRGQDGFAKRPIDNVGVQYGLEALNRPVTDPGKITMAQFIDLNLKIGGVDIDGLPTLARTRTDADVSRIAYRSGMINDAQGLARAAIINFAAPQNVEIHTPYHAYVLEARMAAIGHQDNHAIWHNGPSATAFSTMDAWLTAVEAAGGIDPLTGMNPAVIKATRPATAFDSCWSGNTQSALSNCASMVYGDARLEAGMPQTHEHLECQLKPISAADYPGAGPLGPTAADLALLAQIFPSGVCDYTKPPRNDAPSVQWLTYRNGPGGQPLGPVPTSTPF